jgi:hypothetical protein
MPVLVNLVQQALNGIMMFHIDVVYCLSPGMAEYVLLPNIITIFNIYFGNQQTSTNKPIAISVEPAKINDLITRSYLWSDPNWCVC